MSGVMPLIYAAVLAQAQPAGSILVPKGLFFGTAQDGHAWLIHLNSDARTGVMYDPIVSLPLCQVRQDSSGGLVFESGIHKSSWKFRFAGRLVPPGFVGTLNQVGRRSGKVERSYDVAFRGLGQVLPENDLRGRVSGVYGDVQLAGGEDLLGWELGFVAGTEGFAGFWVDFEGAPGPPKVVKAELAGDTVHVWWPPGEYMRADTALVRGARLVFQRGRSAKRMATLGQMLELDSHAACP
ncbi:MAG TPA: hypothetical protein VEM27_11075 [Gemmatimonadales bacterium]|nr:hypothetical protein [Gemmatimonadales bacterium]